MKGDPSCAIRYGYTESNGKVLKVPKGSGAELAGMKVGDIILAIDSESPANVVKNEEKYLKRLKVPLKLKRGDKIIRSEIQPTILCP
jgi:predicted metalloprotease with PDZ domain